MKNTQLVPRHSRVLSPAEFYHLQAVPPAVEWFANITNPNTRDAYQTDLTDFMRFTGIGHPDELRQVTRAHVIAWRKDLERRACSDATIRRKLAALSSLFNLFCEQNAVLFNPVDGVKRPKADQYEGVYAGALGCADAGALERATGRDPEGETGPGVAFDVGPSCAQARGVMQTPGEGRANA